MPNSPGATTCFVGWSYIEQRRETGQDLGNELLRQVSVERQLERRVTLLLCSNYAQKSVVRIQQYEKTQRLRHVLSRTLRDAQVSGPEELLQTMLLRSGRAFRGAQSVATRSE